MKESLVHYTIIIHNTKPQTLKFLLKSMLDKVMGSSVSSSSALLTVQPMIFMKRLTLPTEAQRRRLLEGRNRQPKK